MIHVYFGNGKGKTTAAFGLAIRAIARNFRVCVIQFLKSADSGEVISAKKLGVEVLQFGNPWFVIKKPKPQDIAMAEKGWNVAQKKIFSKKYDLLVLDEFNVVLFYKMLNLDDVLKILSHIPKEFELVLTGRYAPQAIIDIADIVTEMREIKHYYKTGIMARAGIEF